MTSTVRAHGIRHAYGRHTVLEDVSFSLEPGLTGLLGPNGAGKTTLLRMLATVLAPDGGSLHVLGANPATTHGRLEVRERLGYLPQEPGFYRHFTAFEFVDYVGILKEMTQRRERHDEVRRVLGLVGLTDVAHRKIRKLSGGMRRRVALAQALLGDPDLLILDEPTAGLDPEQRLRFREIVSSCVDRQTVLLSTHQTEDVAALCNRVIVLDQGAMRFDGTPGELTRTAEGAVWTARERDPEAEMAWRCGDGTWRHIGAAPRAAEPVEPSLEDAYLLLVGGRVGVEVSA